jgi:hypothetical protein
MGSSEALYDRLSQKLLAVCSEQTTNIKQAVNLIWLVIGVINARSVALSKIANSLPGEAEAASRVTCIRRWLDNGHVDVWALYQPLLEEVLSGWYRAKVMVVDGTMVFGDRLPHRDVPQIYRLSLLHGCRAVPLGWIVTSGTGLIEAKRMKKLFKRTAAFLAPYAKHVTLLADRGFRDHDWAELCLSVGWRWRIRVPKNTIVTFANGRTCRIDQLGVKPGTAQCFQTVRLTRKDLFGANLAVTWSVGDAKNPAELVAVMTGQHASAKTLLQYAKRTRIEIDQSQMTKAGVFASLGRGDDVTDFDIAIGDDHAINQEFNQLPLVLKSGAGQASLDPLTELGHQTSDGGKLRLLIGLTIQLLILTRQCINLALKFSSPTLIFRQRDDGTEVGLGQTLQLSRQMNLCFA